MAFLRIQRGIFALGVWHYAGSTAYEGTPLADFFRGNGHGGFRYSISLFDFRPKARTKGTPSEPIADFFSCRVAPLARPLERSATG
jgi:hypothetical protein